MTNYHANARSGTNAGYRALLEDQARSANVALGELERFDEEARHSALRSSLILADVPAPVRGYARLLGATADGAAVARVHMLAGQPDEVYRALFSTAIAQARYISGQQVSSIIVDGEALAPHVAEAVTRLGGPYGVMLGPAAIEVAADTADDAAIPESAGEGDEADAEDAAEELPPLAEPLEDLAKFECEDCGREFDTKQGLGAHSRTHRS